MSGVHSNILRERIQRKWILNLTPPRILLLGFAGVIMVGAFLLSLPFASVSGQPTSFINALFTATSAVCVTGLVVVDTGTYWSVAGQAVILLLIQVGGLGFMTMATFFFLLLGKKIGLKTRLVMQASLNQNHMQGIVALGRQVLIFTFVTEFFFALLLTLRLCIDMEPSRAAWFGLFHSISAFNNAGFDLFGDFRSLTLFAGDPVVSISVIMLILLGGLGFGVVVDIKNRLIHKGRLTIHTKIVLVVSAVLIVAGTLFIYIFEFNNTLQPLSPGGKVLAAVFQSVTPRTAGFNTIDISSMYSYTQLFMIALMFIGASPGSTGGGIKTTTLAVLAMSIVSFSRGQTSASIYNRSIPQDQVARSMAIVLLAILLVFSVSMGLMITEGQKNFLMALFETVSAFGTVGLTMGLTPSLTAGGKILIMLTMFLGRLGTMTMVLALADKGKSKSNINYPRGNIMVG